MNDPKKIIFPSYGIKISHEAPVFSSMITMEKKNVDLKREMSKSNSGVVKITSVPGSEVNFDAWFEAGNSAMQKGLHAQAIAHYSRAIDLKSDYLYAIYNRAGAYLALNRMTESLSDYQRVEVIDPFFILAKYNAGVVSLKMGRQTEAIAYFKKVLEINELHLESIYNLGCIYLERKKYSEAIDFFDKAIAINDSFSESYNNRASARQKIGDKSGALKDYRSALKINPAYANALFNYGSLLADCNRPKEAVYALKRAIDMGVNSAAVWRLLGVCQNQIGQVREAAISLKQAVDINPNEDALISEYLHVRMKTCDWSDMDNLRQILLTGVKNRDLIANPFFFATSIDDLLAQREVAESYFLKMYEGYENIAAGFKRSDVDKIKIGYYSSDFQSHATMHLMIEMLEAHSHGKFEWFAFNLGTRNEDDMRRRVRHAVDHFIDVDELSDMRIAELSRDLGIDIAVDLKGYTENSRFGVFAYRCAPLQVSYLGYPGTTGASCMDYLIADPVVIPECCNAGYSENIVLLSGCYQPNDSQRKFASQNFTRSDFDLPEDAFVYCCFNANYKISPEFFNCWMEILKCAVDSVIWIYVDNDLAAENLRKEAQSRGVDSKRLIFARQMENEKHLARYKLADLFLDTYPCNAHTTASDALWAGVPVLTLAGESFASRVASSLLTSLGLTELIASSLEEYTQMAIDLGRDSASAAALKRRLNASKQNAKLFDGKNMAIQLERAFAVMHERRMGGESPSPIVLTEN